MDYLTQLLEQGLWVTLDYDVKYRNWVLDAGSIKTIILLANKC